EESQIVLTASVSRQTCQGDCTRGPVFDLDKLTLPLIIRPRQKGDFFIPSGFGKKTKLQDFFVNSKVPRDMRDTVPLVCSGNNIIWVLGFRTDERFLPDNTTQTFLNLSVQTTKK
ncbi:MAG: tRNA lysidine(34) synthetase TilS, partial [bacterium]